MFDRMSQEQRRDHLVSIRHVTKKMSNIIDALLLLANVRKNDDIPLLPLNMAQIINEAYERLSDQIMEQGAQIVISDTFPSALGYGPWVEEIWVNYLSNALKYGGEPPQIEIGVTAQQDGMACFWVKDKGAGLLPEEQANLFTPFIRLSQIDVEGHGLGLSIVQRIVEKLGGAAGVKSEVGQGSMFYFTLPIAHRSIFPTPKSLSDPIPAVEQ